TAPAARGAQPTSPPAAAQAAAPTPAPTAAPAAATSASGAITILQTADIESWDPNALRSMAGVNIALQVQDTLVDRNLKPQLASSWQSVDNLPWQFDLSPGAKFHNGDAVDADAVKFSLDRILADDNKAASRALFQPVLDHVDVVSPTSVKLVTKSP